MHARVASFEGGDFERLRQVTAERTESGREGVPEGTRRVLDMIQLFGWAFLLVGYFVLFFLNNG